MMPRHNQPPSHFFGLRRFRDDASGAIAILFGLALIPVFLLLGAAIDYSRATDDRTALQRSLDAAVIAGSRQHVADDQRIRTAQEVFQGTLKPSLQQTATASFTLDANITKITGQANASTATTIMSVGGWSAMPISATAQGVIAKPIVRQLDIAMCIDATASMDATLNAVKNNALNFDSSLNAELQSRGVDPFDAMRVRVIFYRDYGGSYVYQGPSYFDPYTFPSTWGGDKVPVWQQSAYVWVYLTDPNRFQYVGDNPPMRASQFWSLPADRSSFSSFVQPETAWGGGDAPESGLECVNEAINSPWARVGDLTSSGKRIDQVYPVIAVWTMSETHPPAWPHSLLHPLYPSTSVMPRTHSGLLLKWNDATRIDQANRMLVFFGNPLNPQDGPADPNGWQPVTQWPGFMIGGSLTQGTNNMVARLAEAVITKLNKPILSH